MFTKAIHVLKNHGVVAYPTEAVYGLGCDPFCETAVKRVVELKKRDISKGLILIVSNWDQVLTLIEPVPTENFEKVKTSWPGAITWVFPASERVPPWVRGDFSTVALRMTAHPIAKTLCEQFAKPIVSTSANLEGNKPAKTSEAVKDCFPKGIDFIVNGDVGKLAAPTQIWDVLTGKRYR